MPFLQAAESPIYVSFILKRIIPSFHQNEVLFMQISLFQSTSLMDFKPGDMQLSQLTLVLISLYIELLHHWYVLLYYHTLKWIVYLLSHNLDFEILQAVDVLLNLVRCNSGVCS